jgi:hypothetical protein
VLGLHRAKLLLILLLAPVTPVLQAQVVSPVDSSTPAEQTVPQQVGELQNRPDEKPQAPSLTQEDSGKGQEVQGKQTGRMFWVVPNFTAVSANEQLPRLSTGEKFHLAAKDSLTDYSSYTWPGILAGQGLLTNADPEFGHGAAAYGRYYWHNFVDGVSGTFFTEAIVPTITHQDPRYYTMGSGGFFRRLGYSISRTFVTKTDSGGEAFNWSEVGGNGLEALVSNAYYPAHDRGARQTVKNWGTQMESAVLNHIFQEFWPDIRTKIFRRK